MKKLVYNLKNEVLLPQIRILNESLATYQNNQVEIIVAPAAPFINYLKSPLIKASQDISIFDDSGLTGSLNGALLASIGVEYIIVGDRARQVRFNETEYDYIKKINQAFKYNFKVIYCIGETREERLRHKTLTVLEGQIARVLNQLEGKFANLCIAYQPGWGNYSSQSHDVVNITELTDYISFIKKLIQNYYGQTIPVLYGGKITQANWDCYRSLKADGFLIGSSEFNTETIQKLISKM